MPERVFRFKQFEVKHSLSAMKVGTDGVLLGAWTNIDDAYKVLDVGTGSGLISLMLAQKSENAHIWGIEIDKEASLEARFNFDQSPWKDRLHVVNADFSTFKSSEKFDLIVSNPPFFHEDVKALDSRRSLARSGEIALEDIIRKAAEFMHSTSLLSLILPIAQHQKVKDIAASCGLFSQRLTRVKPTPEKHAHRILIEFSKTLKTEEISELIIEEAGRHLYSASYRAITKDFYLNF
jgi:tRNA1Val (adenine37-N6)-methyltransferase